MLRNSKYCSKDTGLCCRLCSLLTSCWAQYRQRHKSCTDWQPGKRQCCRPSRPTEPNCRNKFIKTLIITTRLLGVVSLEILALWLSNGLIPKNKTKNCKILMTSSITLELHWRSLVRKHKLIDVSFYESAVPKPQFSTWNISLSFEQIP